MQSRSIRPFPHLSDGIIHILSLTANKKPVCYTSVMSVVPLGPQNDNSLWVHMSNRMSVCLSVFIFAEDVKRVERPTNTKKIPICFGQETEIKLTRKATHTQTYTCTEKNTIEVFV